MKERKERIERKERKRFTTRAPLYARIYQKQCRAQKTEEGFSRIQYAKRECVLRVDDVFFFNTNLKRFFVFLFGRKKTKKMYNNNKTNVPAVKKRTTYHFCLHIEKKKK